MPTAYRRTRRAFYFMLARTLLFILQGIPASAGRRICRSLAAAALALRSRQRRLAERNLALAFPDLDDRARGRRLDRSIRLLGENLFDALTIDRARRRDYEDIDGQAAISAINALRGEGRGVLILTGHLGCWELLGGYLAARLDGLTVVTGRIHNPAVDRLVNARRRRCGLEAVPRDGDLRPLVAALRDRRTVAVLMDQNTRVENRDVPFFGVPVPTPAGFAKLAMRFDAPILPVAIARGANGHRVKHQAPIEPSAFTGADREFGILVECNARLERFIRDDPEEWVWFHDRWNLETGKAST